MKVDRINEFACKIGTVNGTGSASANGLIMQSIFRMGVPVSGKNLFPSNIQGLPTWYEIRVNSEGHVARTPDFKILAHDLAMQVAAMSPLHIDDSYKDEKTNSQDASLMQQPFIKDPSKTVQDLVNETVGKLGENVKVRRFTRFSLGE